MKVTAPSLAPMLRSDTQGRLLARILADPTKEHNLTELVEWAGSSMPTVSREVDRAEQAGIVRSRKTGPTRLVRANEDHPLYPAVRQLILGTYGPPTVIAETFANLTGAEAFCRPPRHSPSGRFGRRKPSSGGSPSSSRRRLVRMPSAR